MSFRGFKLGRKGQVGGGLGLGGVGVRVGHGEGKGEGRGTLGRQCIRVGEGVQMGSEVCRWRCAGLGVRSGWCGGMKLY